MRQSLPELYETKKRDLLEALGRIDYCSLTTDLWTSRANMGYITVTCHFITSDWSLKSAVLSTKHVDESHTAINLAAILKAITDEWNITDKVCCVTTDNAANITNAINHNSWKNLPCFAHKINLVVTNSLSELPELSSLIQSVKNIVSYFHRSTKASDKLKVIQARLNLPEHKLIQHVDTRWNSVFYMLRRYLEQDEAIRTTLCLLNRSDLLIASDKTAILKEAVDTLQPFEAVTTEMSSEKYLSASKIIPLAKSLMMISSQKTSELAAKLLHHTVAELELN
ncbi:PREDICTED: zinc finger BED domain-containing protein 4-like [Amphimedon queenslandica]|uniref:DUF659 domain-containing protein n=1 Tax=Amphimedon queenslandica TaxID=400682 RepID=A0A1X7SF72_AMPQE|nr:PREDICTED: zinc finger BED domain-containing protein 4-like [Amphimedon queenslandica]|eukprot:XP_011409475.1 PREDICTED: zinc finger BED domain-containing protein 4-like [Amphimedon queenslandica]